MWGANSRRFSAIAGQAAVRAATTQTTLHTGRVVHISKVHRALLASCGLGATGLWISMRSATTSQLNSGSVKASDSLPGSSGGRLTWSLQLLYRGLWLFVAFLPVIALIPLAVLSARFRDEHFWVSVRLAIERSKSAALTKWGQWAAVRTDFFPEILCCELATLQTSAPVHSQKQAKAAVAAVPGLEAFSPQPFASGAIAQVHQATYAGRHVAVKVRHPWVAESMMHDFELMIRAAEVIDRIPGFEWVNASNAMAQFRTAMSGQLDLTTEAANLERFHQNFSSKGWVRFPEVLFCTPGVLVESFEHGELMTTFARSWAHLQSTTPSFKPEEAIFLITRGQDLYLQMLMADNFMHADLHPGNVLYRDSPPQIVLLDAGMTSILTQEERTTFLGVLQAMGDGDGRAAGNLLLRFSQEQRCPAPAAFISDIEKLFSTSCQGYGRGVNINRVVRDIMATIYHHRVTVDGVYASQIANMLCLEGLVKDLNPQFNILDAGYPLFRGHQLLGDKWFQTVFAAVKKWAPPIFWTLVYRVNMYAGLNGESLVRFQI